MSFFNDPSKIDPNGEYSIDKLTDFIRRGQDGHSVRESIAMGIEKISSSTKDTEDFTKDTEKRQSDLEERWDNVLRETTDKDTISAPELIEARDGKPSLKTRLDEDYSRNEIVVSVLEPLTANIWYEDKGKSPTLTGTETRLIVKNAKVSDGAPSDTQKLWFDT